MFHPLRWLKAVSLSCSTPPLFTQWESLALSSVWSDSPGFCCAEDYFGPKVVGDLQNQGKSRGQTSLYPSFSSSCFVVFLRLLLPL